MIDIDCEVKQYGREGNVGFRKTKCNYSNSYQDLNRYKLAVAQSAKHKDNNTSIAEPVPDAHMNTKENYSVEFSSKSSFDMAVRGLEDLMTLLRLALQPQSYWWSWNPLLHFTALQVYYPDRGNKCS